MTDRSVIVALDFPSKHEALSLLSHLNPADCALKVGFELYIAAGPGFVEQLVQRGYRVFLDLKFHDIPNTVAGACRAAARLGVWMLNVHALGGRAMIEAARNALDQEHSQTHLLAVTVLTSHDQQSLDELGLRRPISELVTQFAQQSSQWGADGVVCSAQEAFCLRKLFDERFLLVTPGIRLAQDSSTDDQKRIVTPEAAAQTGVNHIVVGRPITRAARPGEELERFRLAFTH